MQKFLVLLCSLVLSGLAASPAAAGSAQILLDARSGQILAAENPDAGNHPASLTKMMTLYLVFQAIREGDLTWDTAITFSPHAASRPRTNLRLKAGDRLTVREVVMGIIVQSANDAATAIAEHLGGTEAAFADRMTREARRLGMSNSWFVNASGLPDDRQISSARDMSTLAVALMREFPEEYKLFATRSFAFRGRVIHGHNDLMYRFSGMDGIKTGYTNASGYNLVSSVAQGQKRVIGVVFGGGTAKGRDKLMENLIARNLPRAVEGHELYASQGPNGFYALITSKRPIPVPTVRLSASGRHESPDVADSVALSPVKPLPSHSDLGWQVQIGSAPSAAEALAELYDARDKVGDELVGLSLNAQAKRLGDSTFYRERFGGFKTMQDALGVCRDLISRHYECMLIPKSG